MQQTNKKVTIQQPEKAECNRRGGAGPQACTCHSRLVKFRLRLHSAGAGGTIRGGGDGTNGAKLKARLCCRLNIFRTGYSRVLITNMSQNRTPDLCEPQSWPLVCTGVLSAPSGCLHVLFSPVCIRVNRKHPRSYSSVVTQPSTRNWCFWAVAVSPRNINLDLHARRSLHRFFPLDLTKFTSSTH